MGIEIKAKLGYSKSPLTLFNLTPYMNNNSSIQYIIDNFGYNIANHRSLKNNVYSNFNYVTNKTFIFKLKIDKNNEKILLIIFDINMNVISNNIYWDFNEIKKRYIQS